MNVDRAVLEEMVRQAVRKSLLEEGGELVREILAEHGVDTKPICYSTSLAMAATGLSPTRLNELLRDEVLIARKDGAKLHIKAKSIGDWFESLPLRGTI